MTSRRKKEPKDIAVEFLTETTRLKKTYEYNKFISYKNESHIDHVYFILADHICDDYMDTKEQSLSNSINNTIKHLEQLDLCKLLRYVFLRMETIEEKKDDSDNSDDSSDDSQSEPSDVI